MSTKYEDAINGEQMQMLISSAGIDTARAILEAFWKSNDEIMDALQSQLQAGDLDGAAASAHALKGSAANLGASLLSERAKEIETACKNGDVGEASSDAQKVPEDLVATRQAFDELLMSAAA